MHLQQPLEAMLSSLHEALAELCYSESRWPSQGSTLEHVSNTLPTPLHNKQENKLLGF